MSLAIRGFPELLHSRTTEQRVGGPDECRLERGGERRPELLRLRRESLGQRAADVDVVVQLVDEIHGQRASDLVVLEQVRTRGRPVVRAQRLSFHPDVESGDEAD